MWLHATHRSIEIEVGHGTHGGLFDGKCDHGYSIRPWIFSRGGPAFGCVERGDKGKCPSVVIYSKFKIQVDGNPTLSFCRCLSDGVNNSIPLRGAIIRIQRWVSRGVGRKVEEFGKQKT